MNPPQGPVESSAIRNHRATRIRKGNCKKFKQTEEQDEEHAAFLLLFLEDILAGRFDEAAKRVILSIPVKCLDIIFDMIGFNPGCKEGETQEPMYKRRKVSRTKGQSTSQKVVSKVPQESNLTPLYQLSEALREKPASLPIAFPVEQQRGIKTAGRFAWNAHNISSENLVSPNAQMTAFYSRSTEQIARGFHRNQWPWDIPVFPYNRKDSLNDYCVAPVIRILSKNKNLQIMRAATSIGVSGSRNV